MISMCNKKRSLSRFVLCCLEKFKT